MDDLVKKQIHLVESKKKGSMPWTVDVPHKQPYYVFEPNGSNQGLWQPKTSLKDAASSRDDLEPPRSLALYSWNIDFMLPYPDSRMSAALIHLENLITNQNNTTTATIIFLAECLQTDLTLIAANPFVRRTFHITDLDGSNWTSGHYGTTILADKRLPIQSCFRVHYSQTRMERDALFLNFTWPEENRTIRVCNTHLESLALEPPLRPPQMEVCARYLHEAGVHAGIAAGDFNAIQDFDENLHSENDLKDAYLELGGHEDDAKGGHTWGQQAATVQRERFGTSRMDKVFYCGRVACTSFERFGEGVEVETEQERGDLVALGFERPWITDHLGVKAVFEIMHDDKASL